MDILNVKYINMAECSERFVLKCRLYDENQVIRRQYEATPGLSNVNAFKPPQDFTHLSISTWQHYKCRSDGSKRFAAFVMRDYPNLRIYFGILQQGKALGDKFTQRC